MATGRGIGVLRLLGTSRRERYGMERVGPQSSGGSHSSEITIVYVVPSSTGYGPNDSSRTQIFTCSGVAGYSRKNSTSPSTSVY